MTSGAVDCRLPVMSVLYKPSGDHMINSPTQLQSRGLCPAGP